MKRLFLFAAMLFALVFSATLALAETQVWDERTSAVETLRAAGSSKTYTYLSATAVVEGTGSSVGYVFISSASHGFYTGSQITINGTSNYDGTHTLTAVNSSGFTISHAYTAETPGGTETARVTVGDLGPKTAFELMGYRLHIGGGLTAAVQTWDYTVSVDAIAGSYYDVNLSTADFLGYTDTIAVWENSEKVNKFAPGDKVDFLWDNTSTKPWGIEILYRKFR